MPSLILRESPALSAEDCEGPRMADRDPFPTQGGPADDFGAQAREGSPFLVAITITSHRGRTIMLTWRLQIFALSLAFALSATARLAADGGLTSQGRMVEPNKGVHTWDLPDDTGETPFAKVIGKDKGT